VSDQTTKDADISENSIDWRKLLGKYMEAVEDFESGAGDVKRMLDGYVSDKEMAELQSLQTEVFPNGTWWTRESNAE
jgi:hypothetical protein